jgi:hypothetical protein
VTGRQPQSEITIQTLFRSRCRIMCPGVALVAIPNAAKRTQWAAQRAKREGMATGFPDMLCFWKGPGIAAIEFKSDKGRVSENQSEWIARLNDFGIPAIISRDADEAVEFLRRCGAPFIGRIAA